MVLPLYFTDVTLSISAAEALVTAAAPTEKTVTAERIPAMILVLILLNFFIVFTPFVVLFILVFVLTVLNALNKFFIVVSPFGLRCFLSSLVALR